MKVKSEKKRRARHWVTYCPWQPWLPWWHYLLPLC